MTKFVRHKKRDANQGAVVKHFRRLGALVDDVSPLSDLGYDLVIQSRGAIRLVEVKDGSRAPSDRKLTKSEVEAQALHGACYAVVTSEGDVERLLHSIAHRLKYECEGY